MYRIFLICLVNNGVTHLGIYKRLKSATFVLKFTTLLHNSLRKQCCHKKQIFGFVVCMLLFDWL